MEAFCLQALNTGLIDNPKNSFYVLEDSQIITKEPHTYVLSDKYNLVECEKPQRFAKITNNFENLAFIGLNNNKEK